jgi:hypothetical protein
MGGKVALFWEIVLKASLRVDNVLEALLSS